MSFKKLLYRTRQDAEPACIVLYMSTGTQTTKTASTIVAGDIIRPTGRRTHVEVIGAWVGRNGRIEIAAFGKGKVVFNLAADELVEVAA